MLDVQMNVRFRRDFRRMAKRGADTRKLREVMDLLAAEAPLPEKYRDHGLTGDFAGCWDLHIEPDWVLVYEICGGELRLIRTGTHSDLEL